MARAEGTRTTLLTNEPFATAHTTGSSRSGCMPVTCCALSARSSPNTPAAFFAATLVRIETSSSTLAMSSISASRLAPAIRKSLREIAYGTVETATRHRAHNLSITTKTEVRHGDRSNEAGRAVRRTGARRGSVGTAAGRHHRRDPRDLAGASGDRRFRRK